MSRPAPILGVRGLSETRQSLKWKGLYRLGLQDVSLRNGCAIGCLLINQARGVPLACLLAPEDEALVNGLRQVQAELGQAPMAHIYRFRNGDGQQPQRRPAAGLLAAIKALHLPPGTLLLFSGLSQRCPVNGARGLLAFMRALHDGLQHLGLYGLSLETATTQEKREQLLEGRGVAGSGVICLDDDRVELQRFHWGRLRRSALAPVRLRVAGQALVWAEHEAAVGGLGDRVLAQAAAWPIDVMRPASWHFFSNDQALCEQAQITNLPVCVLAYHRGEEFDALARLVHRLRMATGPRATIYVREVDKRLRLTERVVLSRVGMNALLPDDLPVPELNSFIEQGRGLPFTRPVEADFDQALRMAAEDQPSGYVAVERFVEVVSGLLKLDAEARLSACIVCLPLRADCSHVQALQQLRMVRDGDVATADDRSLFVYFHGCQPEQVDMVLQRNFSVPVDELFDGHLIWADPAQIEQALQHLRRHQLAGQATDFSSLMQTEISPVAAEELAVQAAATPDVPPSVPGLRARARPLRAWSN